MHLLCIPPVTEPPVTGDLAGLRQRHSDTCPTTRHAHVGLLHAAHGLIALVLVSLNVGRAGHKLLSEQHDHIQTYMQSLQYLCAVDCSHTLTRVGTYFTEEWGTHHHNAHCGHIIHLKEKMKYKGSGPKRGRRGAMKEAALLDRSAHQR